MVYQSNVQIIKRHYDIVSPFYYKLWGNHIHHGYYITGNESKQKATENLINLIINKAKIKKNCKALDIGCGLGGTSFWLSKNFNCDVTGITISPVQVEIAQKISKKSNLTKKPKFMVYDANKLNLDGKFDVLWAVEMISHLNRRKEFFKNCSRLLNKNGKLCIAGWFKDDMLSKEDEKKYIKPINNRMMVSLWTSREYIAELQKNGLKLRYHEDISQEVKKTWDICLDIIKKKEFWEIALKNGKDIVDFLKAFKDMKRGFEFDAFRYEVMVFEK